ncbi:MAG: hypothetical protein A2289_25845 [Deltaproteobacteria bacterium RIFOXYA12_FULL_58_15]|nr:MAG: hypothetical protein A2289_25845 [Deltaproteobacteria bacterium RIFOXYA12_FULL_58_15]OGR11450.1 MAG: hypothetical protein A2341_28280 [Deltaproteobacteria bacterium RIFOXYB12_FULL_58_9]
MDRCPTIDIRELVQRRGVDFDDAFASLLRLYLDVDRHSGELTAGYDLPCHKGCDGCCHESVFVTPLEFYGVWTWLQEHYGEGERAEIVRRARAIYEAQRDAIRALNAPPPLGEVDHTQVARTIRFRCPLLGDDGGCLVYPVRELYARLFGCSFNEQSGIYGCDLSGKYFANKELTLLRARSVALQLNDLPLTDMRQIYPYYIYELFGVLEG